MGVYLCVVACVRAVRACFMCCACVLYVLCVFFMCNLCMLCVLCVLYARCVLCMLCMLCMLCTLCVCACVCACATRPIHLVQFCNQKRMQHKADVVILGCSGWLRALRKMKVQGGTQHLEEAKKLYVNRTRYSSAEGGRRLALRVRG